jgi:hypothetical protein
MAIVQRYSFFFDSVCRSQGANTDALFKLKQIIQKTNGFDTEFIIQVKSLEVPHTFPTLDSTMTSLRVSITNHLNENKIAFLTFPVGNYTTKSLISLYKKLMLEKCAEAEAGFSPFVPTLSFSFNEDTGYATFATNQGNFTVHFDENRDLGAMFGFLSDSIFSVGNSSTSVNRCISNPNRYILLRCGNLKQSKSSEFVVLNAPGDYSDIIYKMPVYLGSGAYLFSTAPGSEIYITNQQIDSFNLYLTNAISFKPLNLNGCEWSCSVDVIERVRVKHETPTPGGSVTPQELPKQDPPIPDITQTEEYQELLRLKDVLTEELRKAKRKIK